MLEIGVVTCTTEKARANKFVWGLRFTLKDKVVNQRPLTLAVTIAIACAFLKKCWMNNMDHFRRRRRAKTITIIVG